MPPPRPPPSIMWDDVTKEPFAGSTTPTNRCRYCLDTWRNKSLVRLVQHMKKCKKLPFSRYERYERTVHRSLKQPQVDSAAYTISAIDQRNADDALAEAIYNSGLAFSFVSITL